MGVGEMSADPTSILIHRYKRDPVRGTLGRLSIIRADTGGNLFRCATLENPWRDDDADGKSDNNVSCVRAGVYRLGRDEAGRWVRRVKEKWGWKWVPKLLPLSADEEWHRSEILFHWGNNHTHTAGCVLVGLRADNDRFVLSQSIAAYERFFEAVLRYNPYTVTIQEKEGL